MVDFEQLESKEINKMLFNNRPNIMSYLMTECRFTYETNNYFENIKDDKYFENNGAILSFAKAICQDFNKESALKIGKIIVAAME